MRRLRHTYRETLIWLGALLFTFVAALLAHGQEFTAEEVALGQAFFHETRLSANNTVSCATCHQPKRAFTDGCARAMGIDQQLGQFSTPTIFTAPYHPLQFWDGRTSGVDTQSLQPLINPIEMGNDSVDQALNRIRGERVYRAALQKIYGDPRLTQARFGRCITAYELAVNSEQTKVDKRLAGYTRTLTPLAERGFEVFTRLGCASCHAPPLFTDRGFHNTGVSFLIDEIDQVTGDRDLGRFDVLPPGSDETSSTVRAWKTPTLRGVDRSAPYTHCGVVPDLETMVELYARAFARQNGRIDPYIDRRILAIAKARPTADDKRALVRFLREGFSMQAAYQFGSPYRP